MAKQRPITERGPDVIAPPPLLYLVSLVAGLVLDRPLPRLPRAARPAGLPLLVGGIGLLGWFVLKRAGIDGDSAAWIHATSVLSR